MIVLSLLGLAIICGLAVYAALLWRKVKQQRAQQQQAVDKLIQRKQESQQYARDSIGVLLNGLAQQQVTLTEVAIRVTGLAQVFGDEEKARYHCFEALAVATSHIPIREDWRALSKAKQRAFDQERETLEAKYQAQIDEVLPKLLADEALPQVQVFEPKV